MMRPTMLIAAIAAAATLGSSASADPAPAAPGTLTVTLQNFHFAPAELRLVHGRAYRLHLVNDGHGSHNFAAPAFFAAAALDPRSRALAAKGTVDVAGGTSVDLDLVAPAAGTYPVKCSHFMHSAMGMKASIVVE